MIKSYPAPVTDPAIISRITELAKTDLSQQDIIWEMRRAGMHIIPCIKLAMVLWELPHPEAKELVHCSDAWESMREANDQLHENAFAALKELGFEEVPADSLRVAS